MRPGLAAIAATAAVLIGTSCAHAPRPGTPLVRRGDEIVIGGQLFHTGAQVVLWNDPGGLDGYRPTGVAQEASATGRGVRARLPKARDHAALGQVVRTLIVDSGASGSARAAFAAQQHTHATAHFIVDVDGVVYQTLDIADCAARGSRGDPTAVVVHLAHTGIYATASHAALANWYARDARGPVLRWPSGTGDWGVRTPGFTARPARAALLAGTLHGRTHHQYDFTDEQYEALATLSAALMAVLPAIEARVPTDADGTVVDTSLPADQRGALRGLAAAHHLDAAALGPGPGSDWSRLLAGIRRLRR